MTKRYNIMTAKEYRDKKTITDADFWDGDKIDFDAICEFADDYHKAKLKSLNISDIRRSFFNEVYDKWAKLTDDTEFTHWLNNNC